MATVRNLLAVHAGVRKPELDEHMFTVDTGFAVPTTFRLQLFTSPGLRPVAIAIQAANEGRSLTNAAETCASAVWQRLVPECADAPIWIERQVDCLGSAQLELVTFTHVSGYSLAGSSWVPMTREHLTMLVGQDVEIDRGDGYRARSPEPAPEFEYVVLTISELPTPEPFRERCMSPSNTAPSGRDCCWYHHGDWTSVSETAIRLVEQAVKVGTPTEDIAQYVLTRATGEGVGQWELDALESLVSHPQAFEPLANCQGYRNGQHRVRAMIDAGVTRTITVRDRQ